MTLIGKYVYDQVQQYTVLIGTSYTYTTGSSALPDIYARALGLVRIYQAKHECLWYKCYVLHCPCRLIARQYEVETRIYYIDRLDGRILWKTWKVLISD